MSFFDIFKHLLPRARAWLMTTNKQLREFFQGLSVIGSDAKEFLDSIYNQKDPALTSQLSEWEAQFGLSSAGLSDTARRAKLDAAWKALGGQSPAYIQETLQANGFEVYVHDWWVPGSEPAVGVKSQVTPRDPFTYLRPTYPGDGPPTGYPLVNIVVSTSTELIVLCGEPLAECGEPSAECGNFLGFGTGLREYTIPSDPAYWPYFVYIGGEAFGSLADVPEDRQSELEALCLKLCPTQLWIGMLINYI